MSERTNENYIVLKAGNFVCTYKIIWQSICLKNNMQHKKDIQGTGLSKTTKKQEFEQKNCANIIQNKLPEQWLV